MKPYQSVFKENNDDQFLKDTKLIYEWASNQDSYTEPWKEVMWRYEDNGRESLESWVELALDSPIYGILDTEPYYKDSYIMAKELESLMSKVKDSWLKNEIRKNLSYFLDFVYEEWYDKFDPKYVSKKEYDFFPGISEKELAELSKMQKKYGKKK